MYGDTVQKLIDACEWSSVRFLVFSDNVFDPFIYYSHLLPICVSLMIGFFILLRQKNFLTDILFFITILFSSWAFFDLILWATDKPHYTIFFWSLLVLIEPFIYAACLYFVQVFIGERDTSLKNKWITLIPLIPIILLVPTKFALLGYDLSNCDREAIEGPLAHYGYLVEIFYTLWILVFTMEKLRTIKDKQRVKQIIFVVLGILLFLLTFSWGNIVGTFSDDWRLPQWGLFGMPIFLSFLTYSIVRFKTLNIKVIGSQILVGIVWILVVSLLFAKTIESSRIIISITSILLLFVGIQLIKGVKREVEQRERIEMLNVDLERANEGQTNLIHIINHQIKGYLAKSRNIFSELLGNKTYGPIPEQTVPMIEEGFKSLTEGVDYVQRILTSSNAERGTLTYNMAPLDFKTLVTEAIEKQTESAEKKGLKLESDLSDGEYQINGDGSQLKEAVRNLIDNSIIYTKEGSVKVSLENKGSRIIMKVVDTGIGLTDDDKRRLFTKGGRGKDSIRMNANSSGFGLAFVKGVIEAHKGSVKAESAGPGHGSTFTVELPA